MGYSGLQNAKIAIVLKRNANGCYSWKSEFADAIGSGLCVSKVTDIFDSTLESPSLYCIYSMEISNCTETWTGELGERMFGITHSMSGARHQDPTICQKT